MSSDTKQAWAGGGAFFAGIVLAMMGIWQAFVGIAAIAKDQFFVVGTEYLYKFNTTTWGWIQLIVGVIAALAGFYIFTGATWARVIGIIFAVLSGTANFFFIPYYPVWSIVMIGLAIFVIWALAAWRPDREWRD
jgi:hypothetical protein